MSQFNLDGRGKFGPVESSFSGWIGSTCESEGQIFQALQTITREIVMVVNSYREFDIECCFLHASLQ